VAEYLRHAEECEALARTATSSDQRRMIEEMAETWRILARQREEILLRALGDAAR
jgi:hypothetical protein